MTAPKNTTVAELSQRLGVGKVTVRKFIASGELPAVMVRRGSVHQWEIREADVTRFLNNRRQK